MGEQDPTLTCGRCGRESRLADASDWTAKFDAGKLVAVHCKDCATAEEQTEAEVNVALMEFCVDDEGELYGRPKEED